MCLHLYCDTSNKTGINLVTFGLLVVGRWAIGATPLAPLFQLLAELRKKSPQSILRERIF